MVDQSLPRHIAIIMDGNGRWAKKRFLPRIAGHRAGVESAKRIVKACVHAGVGVLSLFAFSSENWRRPAEEVNHLMQLLLHGLEREVTDLQKNNIQLRFIGDRHRFSKKLQSKIDEVEKLTQENSAMVLLIAADYGGQWDIEQAVRKIAQSVQSGEVAASEVNASLISKNLSFSDLPDPDLFIRTSGELRISNFMLWQLAYSELYFSEVLWPDFTEHEFNKALAHYQGRERRFGHSGEQMEQAKC